MNVGELEKIVGLSQSALSQHLAVLRAENIVKTRRVAQTIFYSIGHGFTNEAYRGNLKITKDSSDCLLYTSGGNKLNPKIEKLEKEIEKTKTTIAEMQAKLHKLEEQKTEEIKREN